MLEEDLEAFAEAFGVDESFEVEAGADAIGFVHAIAVEIREVVSLSQSEKKRGLREEAEGFEALARAPLAERCEIDVGGEVLFAWSGVEIVGRLVLRIAEDGAGLVMSVEEICGFVAVVDGEDKAAIEPLACTLDPAAG